MTTGVISNYLENNYINHTLRNTAYTSPGTSVYVALYTSSPTDADSGTEVSGGSYARQQVTGWSAPSSGSSSNSGDIDFPTATASWGTVSHVGIHDDLSAGNLLFWGELTESKAVGNGDTFSISTGDMDLWLNGAMSNPLSGSLINHTLRNTAYTTPGTAIWVALYSDNPTANDTGTEISAGGYARQQFTDWYSPTSGSTANSSVITFGPATAAWGTVSHVGIRDSETSGDLLYYGALTDSKTVGDGDTFRFSASALSLSID